MQAVVARALLEARMRAQLPGKHNANNLPVEFASLNYYLHFHDRDTIQEIISFLILTVKLQQR